MYPTIQIKQSLSSYLVGGESTKTVKNSKIKYFFHYPKKTSRSISK